MPTEKEMIGYSIKDWKAKFYPNGNHINLNNFTKIPNDLVICDVCNRDIRQPEDDTKKVVWNYDDSEKGMWSICTECKEHPERLENSFRLFANTKREIIEMMEPCLRESTKKMIDEYGLEKYVVGIKHMLEKRYLEKNKDGQIVATKKCLIDGSGAIDISMEKLIDGQVRWTKKR